MKVLCVAMDDGSVWAVPVEVIARDRAAYYAPIEFDGDIERSLSEDTLPLFAESEYDIEDWAIGNMNWSDVEEFARKIEPAKAPDFQKAWNSNEKCIRTVDDAAME